MIALLMSISASASGLKVVRTGDSVESIADALGDPTLAPVLRQLNALDSIQQPDIGDVLILPTLEGQVELSGVLLSLWGHGELIPAGGIPAALTEGMHLPVGSVVCTDTDSYATIQLAVSNDQHDEITLLGSSCITLESVSMRQASRRSVVSLTRGGLTIRSADAAGAVTVLTESGLATGDGGGFRVSLEDTAVRAEALYAGVTVFGAGEEVAVDAGFGSRVITGEPPSVPSRLLAPEALLTPEDGAPLRRPDFTWTPVARAPMYLIEVATNPEFSQIIRAVEVVQPEWSPEVLLSPYRVEGLWWRVSPIDRIGFVGQSSVAYKLSFPVGTGL
ncbi:MAG: LysM peptidoglycan-binding domain-containing protein [Myxococcota bacterium]|nr:LysM peptidoglycan-binding domain-containing protein [Myxococcota bacterium]